MSYEQVQQYPIRLEGQDPPDSIPHCQMEVKPKQNFEKAIDGSLEAERNGGECRVGIEVDKRGDQSVDIDNNGHEQEDRIDLANGLEQQEANDDAPIDVAEQEEVHREEAKEDINNQAAFDEP